MQNDVANKLIPVKDGVAGTPIDLHDCRIKSESAQDGDILSYDSTEGLFVNKQISYDNTDYVIISTTGAGTQTKTGSSVTSYTPVAGGTYPVHIKNANSYNGAIKFKGNSVPSAAQTIYINGTLSSATNKTLPAGLYLAYYNGTTWFFCTDGSITVNGINFSCSYNDLNDLPTIPAAQVQTDWNATTGMGVLLNKPTLAAVATSGSYTDLSNKPTIPTVPTNVSDFTNDAGYITANDVPTEVVYFTWTLSGSTYTSSITPANILAAVKANKCVIGIEVDGEKTYLYYCMYYSEDKGEYTLAFVFTSDGYGTQNFIYDSTASKWTKSTISLQPRLIDNGASQNIKTINNTSLLGSGNITIHEGDDNVQSDWSQTDNTADDFIKNKPTNVSSFTNDAGYITSDSDEKVTPTNLTSSSSTDYRVLLAYSTTYSTNGQPHSSGRILANGTGELKAYNFIKNANARTVADGSGLLLADGSDIAQSTFEPALPAHTSSDNGKVLKVDSSGNLVWDTDQTGSGGTAPKETQYTTCSTATATSAKEITLTGYTPVDGDLLAVKFQYNAGTNAYLNINSVQYRIYALGVTQTECILAGDTVLFSLIASSNPKAAHIVSIDRANMVAATLNPIHIYSGSSAPDSDTGSNGDIYIKTTA